MQLIDTDTLAVRGREELLQRNNIFKAFFKAETPRLAETCHEKSHRFLAGGSWLSGTVLP
jgi:hypothetical protein